MTQQQQHHWRVYLLEGQDDHGRGVWREFGVNYPTQRSAIASADVYRNSFPHRVYRVRKQYGYLPQCVAALGLDL